MKLDNILKVSKHSAILAGKEIMKIYATDFDSNIEIKADNSPLTIADKSANDIIIETLSKEFPDISILSEESIGDETRFENDWCFIVDPLDGTKEFIKKNGQFTVNIALAHKHKVVLGVVYVPVTQELFYGAEGIGSFKEKDGDVNKISVSDKLKDLIWVGSKSHSSEKEANLIEKNKKIITETISAGSSLKGLMVAEGKADVYYRFGLTCEWDTAAMHCIVEQAGGIFKQMDGSKMTYNRFENLNEKGFYIVNRKENIWV